MVCIGRGVWGGEGEVCGWCALGEGKKRVNIARKRWGTRCEEWVHLG